MNPLPREKLAGGTAVLEHVGRSTLTQLEYVGGLGVQLTETLASMVKTLPLVGNRLR